MKKFYTILAIILFNVVPNIVDSESHAIAYQPIENQIVFSPDRPNPILGYRSSPVTIVIGQSRKENEIFKIKQEEIRKQQEAKSAKSSREIISRVDTQRSEAPSFAEKRSTVQRIAQKHSIDWKILEAVWEVESGKSWDRSVRSYAGAQGPMQFLPSTFRSYAEPGANINSAVDSLEAGAKLLAASGASSGNVDQALFSYNHSWSYVAKVKRIAQSI